MTPTLVAARTALPPEGADFPRGGPSENRPAYAKSVAIIGVGNMGGGMALNLLSRGWQVAVHDIDAAKVEFYKQKGALAGVFIAQYAINNIATIVCVVTADQVQDALFGTQGAAQHMPRGHTVLLCPTMAPADVENIAAQLAASGIHCIDAPMSGGPARAADGSMSLMAACEDVVFEAQRELLQALSSKLFRISQRVGDGARTKLVNNLLAGINLVGAAEAMALAERLGLDLAATLDVIEQSSGQSWIGSDRMLRALNGDFAPRAHVTLLQKDTALAVAAAKAAGFAGPLGERAAQVFAQAHRAGMGDEDDAALFKLLRQTVAK
jgi:L-threonate 2-dehydrogenase